MRKSFANNCVFSSWNESVIVFPETNLPLATNFFPLSYGRVRARASSFLPFSFFFFFFNYASYADVTFPFSSFSFVSLFFSFRGPSYRSAFIKLLPSFCLRAALPKTRDLISRIISFSVLLIFLRVKYHGRVKCIVQSFNVRRNV